jgi:hypothetical protein
MLISDICRPQDYRQLHYTLRLLFVRYFVEAFKDVRNGRSKSSYRPAPWYRKIFLARRFLLVIVQLYIRLVLTVQLRPSVNHLMHTSYGISL